MELLIHRGRNGDKLRVLGHCDSSLGLHVVRVAQWCSTRLRARWNSEQLSHKHTLRTRRGLEARRTLWATCAAAVGNTRPAVKTQTCLLCLPADSWAIYGFTTLYTYTQLPRFLEHADTLARYWVRARRGRVVNRADAGR